MTGSHLYREGGGGSFMEPEEVTNEFDTSVDIIDTTRLNLADCVGVPISCKPIIDSAKKL